MRKSGIESLSPAPSVSTLSGNTAVSGMGFVAENGSKATDMKDILPTAVPTYAPETVYSQVSFHVYEPAMFPLQEVLIAFFLGGCLVIVVLVLYDSIQRRKNQGS
jgi:hypothetical protein